MSTEHLRRVNTWRPEIPTGRRPIWPVGIEVQGNAGVARAIAAAPGRWGTCSPPRPRAEGLSVAALENRTGRFVLPSPESVAATLSQFELEDDFRLWVPDPIGDDSYPITTYTLVVTRPSYRDAETAAAVKAFLGYVLSEGGKTYPQHEAHSFQLAAEARCWAA